MEKKTYIIKIKKTAENGEKYFVNQTYVCKDKLTKYEEKMARYRKNLQRKNKKRALFESQFEYIEEEVKLPYKIVTTKPRADHGKKTDCIFEWSKTALAAKKALNDMKERAFRIYTKNGEYKACEIYRHPKLSELTFEIKEPKKQVPLTKEQQHELHVKYKAEKKAKYESLEFSNWHKNLIAKAYSTENHRLKQAAREAAHEAKIQKMMKDLRKKKLSKYKYRLEFRKLIGTEPKVFITNYSNKSFAYLDDVMKRLASKLVTKIEDFISINIFDNQKDKLMRVHIGWNADDIHYKNKLENMKALYPDYYANAA